MNSFSVSPLEDLIAIVHRGRNATTAGLQFQIAGRIHTAAIIGAPHKKKPLRVAVGVPGCMSSVWRIWAHRNASDVYIASSPTAHIHKISLHESGDWRYQAIGSREQLTASEQVGHVASEGVPEGRVLGSWRRPQEVEHGWIAAMSIVVPGSELIPHPNAYLEERRARQIEWIEAPPMGFATEIRFYIVQPGKGALELNDAVQHGGGFSYLGGIALPSGEVLLVMSSAFRIEPDLQKWIRDQKAHGLAHGAYKIEGNYATGYQYVPRILMPEFEPQYATFWDLCGY